MVWWEGCVEGMGDLVDLAWVEKVIWFIFKWRATEGEWCGWLAKPNRHASYILCVCPTAINFFGEAFFGVFSCNCDEHVTFDELIEEGVNSQHKRTSSINTRFLFFFCRVSYGEDIINGLYINWNSMLCDVVSIHFEYKTLFHTYLTSLCIQNDTLHQNRPF